MLKETYNIPNLPLAADFETLPIMKALTKATRALAEVKGRAPVIPNQGILIDTLSLQEAKDSSEIESIVTTNDDLFRSVLDDYRTLSGPTKEVAVYRNALRHGYEKLYDTGPEPACCVILDVFDGLKMIPAKPFGSDGTIVSFNIGVLLRLTRLDVHQGTTCLFSPVLKRATDVFRGVVHTNGKRFAAPTNDLIQAPHDPLGRHRPNRPEADHALTIKPDHPMGACHDHSTVCRLTPNQLT